MKRVYCVFESRWCELALYDNYGFIENNYDDRLIDIYDNHQAAVLSIKDWAEHHPDIVERRSGDYNEAFDFKETSLINSDFKYNVTMCRKIRSILLKSS